MKPVRHLVFALFLMASLLREAAALEVNYWPLFNGERVEEGAPFHRWQAGGPILFGRSKEDAHMHGIRPLWVRFDDLERERGSVHVLYPFFNYRRDPQGSTWDVLKLIRSSGFKPEEAEGRRTFHLFPILFYRNDRDQPEESYFGIFPLAGTVQNQLGYSRITWFFFPFARFERGEVVTVAMPWPFIRFVDGEGVDGFHLWPLYGQVEYAGRYDRKYWLWPLGYRVRNDLWKETPFEAFGFIPFYTQSSSEKAVSETFVWPFFGYTDSRSPEYFERRYFWPLLVQRRGASYNNRWAPFYTHSIHSGVQKRWVMWPIYRSETKIERDLLHEKTQIVYFLLWNLRQSDPLRPEADPAIKRHLWPFFSYWDNGAGRRQLQVLSPFEVFFPYNDVVRAKYSPLFAIYRFDRQQEGTVKNSLLFDFVTWGRENQASHLNVGPLVSYSRAPNGRQWEILKGLFGYDGTNRESRFRFLWVFPGSGQKEETE